MHKTIKKLFAYVLTFCMVLGLLQTMGTVGRAAAADGVIDTSEEGYETVRYYTGAETEVTSAQTKNERLSDFFEGTESMVWSVEFKTSGSGLQSLLALNTSDKYYVLYIKSGNVAFEVRGGQIVKQTGTTNYADGQWHTATLEIQKNGKTTLSIDGQKSTEANTESGTLIAGWTPTAFTIGGVTGYGTASQTAGWTFSGSMRNIVLKKAVTAARKPAVHIVNPERGSTQEGIQGELASGSVQLTYRLEEAKNGRISLLGLSKSGEIYLDTASGKVGLRAGSAELEILVTNTALNTEKWHNLAVTLDGAQARVYVDGVLAGSGDFAGIVDASALQFGTECYYSAAELYDGVLTAEQVETLHENTLSSVYPDQSAKLDGYYKTENREIFNAGFDGSVAYRIPAIVTSRKTGTVIAAIDKRWTTSADTGINDSVIRRSEDNGETWGPVIPAIDLADYYGYTMDPEMVVDNDPESEHYGRIYMLVDMFRDGMSLWNAQAGTGYVKIDGKYYQKLTDSAGNSYTVRENGVVYDSSNNKTAYQVETEAKAPYREQGSLYKNGEKIGSIYKGAELTMYNTCYLWMTYSDDDGLTWSIPKDLTPMVKADWMTFFGTGPGAGLQLQSGRLIFTTYSMDSANSSSRFCSFNVYTDDDGETWHRGASPNDISETQNSTNSTRELNESCLVELDNGHLIQFMKNATNQVAMAVSTTQGESWGTVTYAQGIQEPYCEMSVVHYPEKLVDPRDGQAKEAILFANPDGTTGNHRDHGKVRIAFVNEDDTLEWAYAKLIEDEKFLYSSLTVMNDGNVGLIYENEKGDSTAAAFTSFSPQYIMDSNTFENTPQPTSIKAKVLDASGNETDALWAGNQVRVEVKFDDIVFAAGDVTLNIQAGDEVKEAALIGNVSADTLAFGYTIQESDEGTIKALAEVNVKENGAAETIYNVRLTNKPFVTKTVTLGTISKGAGDFAELSAAGMSAAAGSEYAGTTEGPASNVLDGDLNTHWHSNYPTDNVSNGGRSKHWITIDLGGTYLVNGLVYTPRSGGLNGCVTKYQIEVSTDGVNFQPVAQGDWLKNSEVKTAEFYGPVVATHVMLRVLETNDEWATAAEIRVVGSEDVGAAADCKELIAELTKYAEYEESVIYLYPDFADAIRNAKKTASDISKDQTDVDRALQTLKDEAAACVQDIKEAFLPVIESAKEKKQEDYNISSWMAHSEALKAAERVTGSSTADDTEILDAYLKLLDAEKELVGTTAVTETKRAALENAAAELEKLNKEDYTEESWKKMQAVLEAAKQLIGESNLRERITAMDNAALELKLAKSWLVTKEEAELQEAKRTAQTTLANAGSVIGKGKGNCTDASWKVFTDAYAKLEEALANADSNAGTLKVLISALEQAKAGLKEETPIHGDDPAPVPVKGKVYSAGNLNYKVTDLKKKTVSLVGTSNKKLTSLNVKKTVKIYGVTFKVTSIGAKAFAGCGKLKKVTIGANVATIGKQAFSGCKKLKNIKVSSKKIARVGSGALKGIDKKAVIKVPSSKKKKYQKVFAKRGQAKTVKIK